MFCNRTGEKWKPVVSGAATRPSALSENWRSNKKARIVQENYEEMLPDLYYIIKIKKKKENLIAWWQHNHALRDASDKPSNNEISSIKFNIWISNSRPKIRVIDSRRYGTLSHSRRLDKWSRISANQD